MAYHPPPLQPLWSFASPASLPHVAQAAMAPYPSSADPVVGWGQGPDGRPVSNWAVARSAPSRP
jgi:hypothetical protein